MFRQVVFFFCLALLAFGGYQIYLAVAPPETQIGWTLDGAVKAFNERDLPGCVAAFTDDYRDTSQGGAYEEHIIDRQVLEQGLDSLFKNRLEPGTGDFLYQAQLLGYTLSITLESDIHAAAQFRMVLKLKMGHTWTEVWNVDVKARLRRVGRRWLISSSSLRTLSGTRPWNWE